MVRTLENYHSTIKENMSNTIYLQTSGLSPEVQNGVAEYYNHKLDNRQDIIHHDDMAKIAFYKTIEHGFLSLFMYEAETDRFLFNEGYFHNQIRPLIKNYLHRLSEKNKIETYPVYIDERLYDLELRLIIHDSKKYIFGIIVQEMYNQTNTINHLEKFFSRYYYADTVLHESLHEYNCLPGLNELLYAISQKAYKNGQSLYYIFLEIEPLKKYIKVAGDYLVNEIIKNVQEMISSIIKDSGNCYILNSRQYLVTVTNTDERSIKEKFGHAHFRIKNLLLIYQMNYYQVTDFENGYTIEHVWPHLLIK